MGSRYLTDLASVIRNAGLPVKEYSGWQSRARGSGGYESGRPTHIMCHHTASSSSQNGQPDADYIAEGSGDAPLANLYIDRQGLVWVLAAGATNTNGKGRDTWGGGVPDDSMNSYAIGIEAGNNGTGEAWPTVQQDNYVRLVKALMAGYGIPLGHVRAHFEWAPDRKIDPAGNSRYATGGNKWNMDQFRTDCYAPAPEPPDPTPPVDPTPLEDEMRYFVWKKTNGGYCMGIPGAWGCHIDSDGMKKEAFASGTAINLGDGRIVSDWSGATSVADSFYKPKFPVWLGDNYGK